MTEFLKDLIDAATVAGYSAAHIEESTEYASGSATTDEEMREIFWDLLAAARN